MTSNKKHKLNSLPTCSQVVTASPDQAYLDGKHTPPEASVGSIKKKGKLWAPGINGRFSNRSTVVHHAPYSAHGSETNYHDHQSIVYCLRFFRHQSMCVCVCVCVGVCAYVYVYVCGCVCVCVCER